MDFTFFPMSSDMHRLYGGEACRLLTMGWPTQPKSSQMKLSNVWDVRKYADDMVTYVVWHLQDSKHKEDVFLSVLELFVFKLSVELPVSQREVFVQLFEVGCDVWFGLRLPLEPEASACSVYLLQQLQWEEQPVDNTCGQIPARCHSSQISQSWFLSLFFPFWLRCWTLWLQDTEDYRKDQWLIPSVFLSHRRRQGN